VTTVVIAATRLDRVREALRAALGLGLRGATVEVWLGDGVAAHRGDPQIARSLALLVELGQRVRAGAPAALPPGVKLERWTDGEPPAELDLRGEVCPFTFVRTRLALEAMPLGAALIVTVDHEPARRNVPRSAAEWGQEVVAVDDAGDGRWRIRIIKRAD
jgi:TusA-related sulfurtransferase